MHVRGLLVLATLLAATACTQPAQAPAPGPDPSDARTSEPTPSTPPSTPPKPQPQPVTIALAGDVHFEGVLADRLTDPATALRPAGDTPALGALAAADLAILNLETSLGTGGRPEPGKRFAFAAPATALTALAAAGVDVASMANNHALDFGRERLPSTFAAIAAARPGLDVIGIGRDADAALRPARADLGGTVVATLAASVADQDPTADPTAHWAATTDRPGIAVALDPRRLLRGVRRADRSADVVVAHLHWGVQGDACPSPEQRSLARRLVRAGADVVAGSHTHRLQGHGRLGRGYVAYGLGNFAWYSPGSESTSRTGVLTLTVRPPASRQERARVVRAAWTAGRIGTDGLPGSLTGVSSARLAGEQAALRRCAGLSR